jgi:hypothetical protein
LLGTQKTCSGVALLARNGRPEFSNQSSFSDDNGWIAKGILQVVTMAATTGTMAMATTAILIHVCCMQMQLELLQSVAARLKMRYLVVQ